VLKKLRYLPPNLITLLSLTLGLVSIYYSLRGAFVEASWLILYSVLLDKLDGTVARLMNAQSEMGLQLDSFADFTAFGLAPAFVLFGALQAADPLAGLEITHGLGLIYIIACVLRLARFNAYTDTLPPNIFQGIPSTHAGGLASSGLLLAMKYGYDPTINPEYLGMYLCVLGVLMVSPFYLPKVGSAQTKFWQWVTTINVSAAYVLIVARTLEEFLFSLALLYLILGIWVGHKKFSEQSGTTP
jgi:CDP-diacylglycerol--serine O-phosphatidyltransferase